MGEIRKSANDKLTGFNGTENYYKSMVSSNIVYTDGVKALATDYECYWLLDIVFSVQGKPSIKAEDFQVWELTRVLGTDVFLVICKSDDGEVLYSQDIPFSDFKDDYCKMWLVENCLLLPSEY